MSKARDEYYAAKKTASTSCGSCRSKNCKFCQAILAAWKKFQDELLEKK